MRRRTKRMRVAIMAVMAAIAGVLTGGLSLAGVAGAVSPGYASVTVVHGIPNTPVDVYVNGTDVLPNFTYKTVSPALSVPPGTYAVAVRPAGASATSAPILSATETLTANENATIVANLDPAGNPELTTFANPTTPTPAGDATVIVRHTAEAPAVDVYAGSTKIISSLTNPNQASLNVPASTVPVSVTAAGGNTPVIGPLSLPLVAGHVYVAYAVGSLGGGTLTAVLQSYAVGQSAAGKGYVLASRDGGIFAFGSATFVGSLPSLGIRANNIVGVATTADGKGYWEVSSNGGVYAFGDALFEGSAPGAGLTVNNIVGIVPSPDGLGYLLVGSDGGVYAFGDATYAGSLPGLGVRVSDITGIATLANGAGYWLVGADGGVFAFGAAPYEGSVPGAGATVHDAVGIAATADGGGYTITGADGGVFAFGDAGFAGSLPSKGVNVGNVVGITGATSVGGYQLVGANGGVYAFGGATFAGSLPSQGLAVGNVVAASAT